MVTACLDLEGVLIPEVWQNVASQLGIAELNLTTRDIPDYHDLMKHRLRVLDEHSVTIDNITETIRSMRPLPGAVEFLDELRTRMVVILLSDTYQEFMPPILSQLKWPTLLCNSLSLDESGRIRAYHLRQENGKYHAVHGFQNMNLEVRAAGDSYNDLAMIQKADRGALFRPPEKITEEHPEIPVFTDYHDLFDFLVSA